jgi:hypothetical protein
VCVYVVDVVDENLIKISNYLFALCRLYMPTKTSFVPSAGIFTLVACGFRWFLFMFCYFLVRDLTKTGTNARKKKKEQAVKNVFVRDFNWKSIDKQKFQDLRFTQSKWTIDLLAFRLIEIDAFWLEKFGESQIRKLLMFISFNFYDVNLAWIEKILRSKTFH